VSGSDKSRFMCCVCGQLSGKQRQMSWFYKVVRQHYSGKMGEFIIFRCEILLRIPYT